MSVDFIIFYDRTTSAESLEILVATNPLEIPS